MVVFARCCSNVWGSFTFYLRSGGHISVSFWTMTTKVLAGLSKAKQEVEIVQSESFTKTQIFVKTSVISDSEMFVHLNKEFLRAGILGILNWKIHHWIRMIRIVNTWTRADVYRKKLSICMCIHLCKNIHTSLFHKISRFFWWWDTIDWYLHTWKAEVCIIYRSEGEKAVTQGHTGSNAWAQGKSKLGLEEAAHLWCIEWG